MTDPNKLRIAALHDFSEDQLLEELARRRNETAVDMPQHWCDDCKHFKTWDEAARRGAMPDNFNPCAKRHAMQFMVPQDYDFINYGFYRRVCADRVAA